MHKDPHDLLSPPLLLKNARLWAPGAPSESLIDVALDGGKIAALGHSLEASAGTAEVVDLEGRWLMPSLVDHHVHFTLWAKHRARLDVSGQASAAAAAAVVESAIRGFEGELLIGRGFQDALWPDEPTAALLDDAAVRAGAPHVGVVLLSHDLHSVWVSSVAARRFGVPGGLLREAAAFDLEIAVEAVEALDTERIDAMVASATAAAHARGITGIMDLEMADNPAVWAARRAAGAAPLRVRAGVYPQHFDAALQRGERTGVAVDRHGLVTVGPLKVFADGALNTRTAWCFDPYPDGGHGHSVYSDAQLAKVLSNAAAHGFEVALHAIGDKAAAQALDAFAASGARGSVEHAQMVRDQDLVRFAALGVAAGVHPEHALDDRHVTDVMWKDRTGRAFPYGALAAAGAELRMGSDAPVSPLDPWLGISAAVHRTRDDLEPWESANALSLDTALRASWAIPAISVGANADVIAIDRNPSELGPQELRTVPVAVTVTAGQVCHLAL